MLGYLGQLDQDRFKVDMLSSDLELIYNAWVTSGRATNFDPTMTVTGSGYDYMVFTNIVMVGNHCYHCRFGVRIGGVVPSGVLAITDEGVAVFIADQDGRVIVSPGKHGFPRDLKVRNPWEKGQSGAGLEGHPAGRRERDE
jgi:hypothetical protein